MSDVLQRIHKIVGDMTTAAFEDGRKQERELILELIEKQMNGRDSWLDVIALIKERQ